MDNHMQAIEWLGMRMVVPSEWEIVRHSVKTGKGRLVFVDRRQQRLQLSWVTPAGRPNLKQAMVDYRARDLAENPDTRFEDLPRTGRWRGFRRFRADVALTRAGLFHSGLKRWVEAAIFWPAGPDRKLEKTLLEGFSIRDVSGKPTRLCAFGIDLKTPTGWALESAEVKPAAVKLGFRSGAGELTVRRLGMLDTWFDGDLDAFLEKEVGSHNGVQMPANYNGHPARSLESRQARNPLGRWLNLGRVRSNLVWLCPVAHALFTVELTRPARQIDEFADTEQVAVHCCLNPGRNGS